MYVGTTWSPLKQRRVYREYHPGALVLYDGDQYEGALRTGAIYVASTVGSMRTTLEAAAAMKY